MITKRCFGRRVTPALLAGLFLVTQSTDALAQRGGRGGGGGRASGFSRQGAAGGGSFGGGGGGGFTGGGGGRSQTAQSRQSASTANQGQRQQSMSSNQSSRQSTASSNQSTRQSSLSNTTTTIKLTGNLRRSMRTAPVRPTVPIRRGDTRWARLTDTITERLSPQRRSSQGPPQRSVLRRQPSGHMRLCPVRPLR